MYQKEIIYMGLYKDGSRIGNAGFLKVENREEESRFQLKLQNIPYNIKGRFPVRLYQGNDWKEINGISVQEGGGSWEENLKAAALLPQSFYRRLKQQPKTEIFHIAYYSSLY